MGAGALTAGNVDNARRWLAFYSIGTYELLMEIQGALEDFIGATRAGRPSVAAYVARSVVLRCLSIRALAVAGDVPDFDNPLADLFAGLPAEVVTESLALTRSVVAIGGEEAIDELSGYVRAFERELGFEDPPPSVRRPEGLYPALRLARELLPLNQASGFPIALPGAWLPADPS